MQVLPQNHNSTSTDIIPLENVNIIGRMIDNLGKINYELSFINQTSNTINPIHYFALDPKATICKFTMLVGTNVLKGVVQEKTQAQHTYSSAQSTGKKTALIEKISDSDYKVSVGNVEPNQRVIISFNYLIVLELDDDYGFKLNIPTNMGVKYFSSIQTERDWEYKYENTQFKSTNNELGYKFDFELQWISSNQFELFETNQKSIEIEFDQYLTFRGAAVPSDGEINLIVRTKSKPTGYIYEDDETQKAYIISNIKIPNTMIQNTCEIKKNFIFVLDRSGSMGIDRMNNAINALKIFIQNIPSNSYFNVISFGSTYEAFWSNSVPALDSFKQTCITDISSYKSNMGGTEILKCLEDCLKKQTDENKIEINQFNKCNFLEKKTCPSTYENVIIVLTDGDVGSIDSIFQMINEKKMSSNINTRIFSFGLGTQASKQFIKGISDMTFGDWTMINDHDDLVKPVKKIIDIVNQQYYTKVELKSIDGNTLREINSVYPNKIYSMLYEVELNKVYELKLNGLKLKAINPINNEIVEWKIEFNIDETKHFDYSIIKKLYFNEHIRQFEKSLQFDNLNLKERDELMNRIINMSVENNIMNTYTSFVLVDDSFANRVNTIGKDVVVPHSFETVTASSVCQRGNLKSTWSFENSSFGMVDERAQNVYTNQHDVDSLDGGMDMFGGKGKYVNKYNTNINWHELYKLSNNDGSFKFDKYSWKLLCYVNQSIFESHCTKVGLSKELFYNFIILLELYKINDMNKTTLLRKYLDEKYPGIFKNKKIEVETLYNDYINNLKTFKVWTTDSDY